MDIRACKVRVGYGMVPSDWRRPEAARMWFDTTPDAKFIYHGQGFVTLLMGNLTDVRIYSMEVANDAFQDREKTGQGA